MNNADELIPTRRSLLSRLKNWDDQESWRVFFETYWKLIYTAAVRAGLTEAEAQDAVQETIISVLKSMPEFKYKAANSSFKSWLLQLTSWRINDQVRKRKSHFQSRRREEATCTETATVDRIADPASLDWESTWNTDWEKNLMHVATKRVKKKVNAKHYQMFDLHVFKEWPAARVARAFHVNRAKVYLIKHRMSRLLKEEIQQLRRQESTPDWESKSVI